MSEPIFAIDPGPVKSAWVEISHGGISGDIYDNETIFQLMDMGGVNNLAIEMIASYGMPVGAEVFNTCVWIGRFIEYWHMQGGRNHTLVYRKDVKMNLCYTLKGVNDAVIRQALIDRFGGKDIAIGGTKCSKCKGKGWFGSGRPVCTQCNGNKWKHEPGPLHGFHDDMWAALGVAVTWKDNPTLRGTE